MKQENMFDLQYLDMTYEGYYFIPWPDSQLYDEYLDKGGVVPTDGGCFVNMEWIANEADN